MDTPGVIATDRASELMSSPKTNRMQDLLTGGAEARSLKEMVGKLLEVRKAGFPLANKSRKAQKISADVGTAADFLVLTCAVYDQVMYEDPRRNFTTPEALARPNQKGRPIIFKGKATDDKLDALTEQMDFLTSAVEHLLPSPQQRKGPAVPSYALADTANQTRKRQPKQKRQRKKQCQK